MFKIIGFNDFLSILTVGCSISNNGGLSCWIVEKMANAKFKKMVDALFKNGGCGFKMADALICWTIYLEDGECPNN